MTRDRRLLAAVSLDAGGGGVAAASRLLWRSLQTRWPDAAGLLTLVNDDARLTPAHKLRFGARAAIAQAFGGARWVLFSHLGLARVQARLPPYLQRPYGVFLHGIEVWRPLSEADVRVLRRAAVRIANSEFTATRVRREHPRIGPVVACPLALAPDEDARARSVAPRAGAQREPLALMVGRMDASEAYKGHAEAIGAWPAVVAACPGARLVIAGDGADRPRLAAMAEATPVAANIEFTGYLERSRLAELYDRASVFLMPSRGEGFGLVYLEAMARGLACIGSLHDAAGDLIEDGVTGYLVDQRDSAAIAQRIASLLSDASLRDRMGRAGYARFQTSFSFERFSSQLIGLIEAHLERPEAAAPRRSVAVSGRPRVQP
jgi:phosphatidylinositol alpha-1,6-mannosyltransferase